MAHDYDFSGWATRNDLTCSDGRTIRRNAFKECDGLTVPLVWNHSHDGADNVLGHALLENRDDGVYCYGYFNDTTSGAVAKTLVQHKDIRHLSIYANQLRQNNNDVVHGVIREVSLVLAGANPGAYIETVIAHSDDAGEEAILFCGEDYVIHSDDYDDEDIDDDDVIEHSEDEDNEEEDDMSNEDMTVQDVLDTMTDDQLAVLNYLVSSAEDGAEEEGGEMSHNAFEDDYYTGGDTYELQHSALNEIMAEARYRRGSMKDTYIAHAAEYGIENIEFLNPDYTNIYDVPPFINNEPSGWVQVVMNGVHETPFAKVRMMFADITEDEARAKGYIKGHKKKEEVFKLLKRVVNPTTIYKKQKFDRDDMIDADFDVIPWVKGEMAVKLDEEKARAYIFGDGRSSSDEDKINEDCIIPVVSDDDLYSIKVTVTPESGETLEHALMTSTVLATDDYRGSGNTTAFFGSRSVSKMLLQEDKFGHRLYKDVNELAAALGVNRIVKVPVGIIPEGIYGVILDLSDYNVGMKNAGKTNFFDDFDIDYNQSKYLMETRQSGALTRPYSAIVLKAAAEDGQ